MKTLDQVKEEIAALKTALTATDVYPRTRSVLEGIVGELEWVAGDDPSLISMSQLMAGARALVKE